MQRAAWALVGETNTFPVSASSRRYRSNPNRLLAATIAAPSSDGGDGGGDGPTTGSRPHPTATIASTPRVGRM